MTPKVWKLLGVQFLLWAGFLFGSAGTLVWPAAWVFLLLYLGSVLAITLELARDNPTLLDERIKPLIQKGQPLWDKLIMASFVPLFASWLTLIGLDAGRFHWSAVPAQFAMVRRRRNTRLDVDHRANLPGQPLSRYCCQTPDRARTLGRRIGTLWRRSASALCRDLDPFFPPALSCLALGLASRLRACSPARSSCAQPWKIANSMRGSTAMRLMRKGSATAFFRTYGDDGEGLTTRRCKWSRHYNRSRIDCAAGGPHEPFGRRSRAMSNAVAKLLTILDLERIEENIFRGLSPQVGWQRVFGGLVIAQALVATARTVEERAPHSLHGYFLLPGDPSVPIIYEVDRIRDGKSFTTRRCNAIQHGRAIFSLSASFQIEEPGLEHALPMPKVPSPDELPSEAEMLRRFGDLMPEAVRRYFARERPVEMRPVDLSRYVKHQAGALEQKVWMRASARLPNDPSVHRAMLAYLSDVTLIDSVLGAHGRSIFDPGLQVASLDHALWFHRPFRADEWLLYAQDSPSSGSARGFARGLLFSHDGRLIASVVQEGLIRPRPLH